MAARLDLHELSARESERVEWKESVANIGDVVATIVAMANDLSNLGGGYVVCGVREGKDEAGFRKLEIVGLTSSRLKEIEGKVLSDCREKVEPPIIPLTEELPISGEMRRVLTFIVPATGYAHSYRRSGKDASTYYIRIGRETREARNALLRELLVRKRTLEPWDRRANSEARVEDLDLLVLRDYLQQMKLWDSQKLAQGEDQGIPTIIQSMHDEGCPEQIFEVDDEYLTCVLLANPSFAQWEAKKES